MTSTDTTKPKMKKVRLDELLIERGYFTDADQVLRSVMAREVRVNDVYVTSAALKVSPDADIFVKNRRTFVSRGGHKLQGALDAFGQDVTGKTCIDVGSSTGGFTDCLLQAGAASVACVDVNYGQLAWTIRTNPRVRVFERTNIKTASPEELGAPFDIIVCDVSFIGMAGLAPLFARLCHPKPADANADARVAVGNPTESSDANTARSVFIGLIKPQFESQPGETNHGVVESEEVRQRTISEVRTALELSGFCVTGVVESPIKGPEGNIEYLVRAEY